MNSWTTACRTDSWLKRRRGALAPIPCRRIKEVTGPMTSSFIRRTSRVLLIRLFQQTTDGYDPIAGRGAGALIQNARLRPS
jgi:hypothetical protein